MAITLNSRTVIMQPSAAQTSTGTAGANNYVTLPSPAWGAWFFLECTAVSGTTPTLIVTIQDGWLDIGSGDTAIGWSPTGSENFVDGRSFTQITGTANRIMKVGTLSGQSNVYEAAFSQNALASNTQTAGPLGDTFRVAWQITGSSPSFTFSVLGKFFF